tara:strand:+ start:141 stop:845 length:705 start_codon:yes stop_codon:yes gene_type:complete
MKQSLEQQILSRSDYHRGLLIFIESNPGCTEDDMFNSPVANALIPIGIRELAIELWVDKLIADGYIQEKTGKLYSADSASWKDHNIVRESKMKITKRKLKQIIKEEYTRILLESTLPPSTTDSDVRKLNKIWRIGEEGHKLVVKGQRGSLYTGIGNREGLYGFAAKLAREKWVRGEKSLFRKLKKLQVGDVIQQKISSREIYTVAVWTQGLFELVQTLQRPEEIELVFQNAGFY